MCVFRFITKANDAKGNIFYVKGEKRVTAKVCSMMVSAGDS